MKHGHNHKKHYNKEQATNKQAEPATLASADEGDSLSSAQLSLPKLPVVDKASRKGNSKKVKKPRDGVFEHGDAAPPKDPWDFDPSIEILSVEGVP